MRPCFDFGQVVTGRQTVMLSDTTHDQRSCSLSNDDLATIGSWCNAAQKPKDNASVTVYSLLKATKDTAAAAAPGVDKSHCVGVVNAAKANNKGDEIAAKNACDSAVPSRKDHPKTDNSTLSSPQQKREPKSVLLAKKKGNPARVDQLKANLEKYQRSMKRSKSWEVSFAIEGQSPLKKEADPMLSSCVPSPGTGRQYSSSWSEGCFDDSSMTFRVGKQESRHSLSSSSEEQVPCIDSTSTAELDCDAFETHEASEDSDRSHNMRESILKRFGSKGRRQIHLYAFLMHLLDDEKIHGNDICWMDRWKREFKLLCPTKVAKKWGDVKQKPNMTYDKLSRALRYYYKKNIIEKVSGHQYVYRFTGNTK